MREAAPGLDAELSRLARPSWRMAARAHPGQGCPPTAPAARPLCTAALGSRSPPPALVDCPRHGPVAPIPHLDLVVVLAHPAATGASSRRASARRRVVSRGIAAARPGARARPLSSETLRWPAATGWPLLRARDNQTSMRGETDATGRSGTLDWIAGFIGGAGRDSRCMWLYGRIAFRAAFHLFHAGSVAGDYTTVPVVRGSERLLQSDFRGCHGSRCRVSRIGDARAARERWRWYRARVLLLTRVGTVRPSARPSRRHGRVQQRPSVRPGPKRHRGVCIGNPTEGRQGWASR